MNLLTRLGNWLKNLLSNTNPYLAPEQIDLIVNIHLNDFNLTGIMPNGLIEQYQGSQLAQMPPFPYQPPQEFAANMYGGLISRT